MIIQQPAIKPGNYLIVSPKTFLALREKKLLGKLYFQTEKAKLYVLKHEVYNYVEDFYAYAVINGRWAGKHKLNIC